MSRKICSSVCVAALLSLAACAAEGPAGRLGFAITMPAAEVSEIESVGFYALDLSDFDCGDYAAGGSDPVADNPESVVAARFEYIESLLDGGSVVFSDVPVGRWVALVECYDAGGRRIFLGCGEARIEEGSTVNVEIEMREDPLLNPR